MAGDPAELAFGHALAMLGDPDAASDVAISALRRAGRARRLVLAHARHQAVARAAEDEPVDLATLQLVVLDLPALAATLASTRPPEERAVLDLRTRVGGDLADLGEALGWRPTAAAEASTLIASAWEAELDPALLAFSGAGDCEGLAAILDEAAPATVGDLLAIAPAVGAHARDCVACTDRIRAMNSVHSFFSAGVAEVPAAVRDASVTSRRLRPSAPPPPLFGEASRAARWRGAITAERIAAVAAVVIALGGLWIALDRRGHNNAVANLTRVAKTAGVTLTPRGPATLELTNTTDHKTTYRVAASAEWLRVSPPRGALAPRATQLVTAAVLDSAPEGENRVTVTVTTGSGATTTRELTFRVEHAPDLAASATGCTVNVQVVEEGDLTSLVLHWRDTSEHQIDITSGPDGYEAMLAPEGNPITYWVTATDARGNAARTADQTIPANAC